MIKMNIISIVIILVLTSCVSYGDITRSDFSAFRDQPCNNKSDDIYLFMENEEVNFKYQKIGLIEVQGGEFSSLSEVMDELKYQAWNNCANAILFVSQSNTTRESGTAFIDDSETYYSSSVLTGTAAYIEMDDRFKSDNQKNLVTTEFIDKVSKRKAQEAKSANAEVNGSIIAGVIGLLVIIIAS